MSVEEGTAIFTDVSVVISVGPVFESEGVITSLDVLVMIVASAVSEAEGEVISIEMLGMIVVGPDFEAEGALISIAIVVFENIAVDFMSDAEGIVVSSGVVWLIVGIVFSCLPVEFWGFKATACFFEEWYPMSLSGSSATSTGLLDNAAKTCNAFE